MEERIAVVDEADRFVRWVGRREIHEQRLVHRSAYVLVFNSKNQMLIQLRHRNKQTYPLHWDISCAGHICAEDYSGGPDDDLDEVYRLTATRELAEELGLSVPLQRLGHFGPSDTHYEQTRLFEARSDGPIRLQQSEVEEARWVHPAEFTALLADPAARLTGSLRRFGVWALDQGCW